MTRPGQPLLMKCKSGAVSPSDYVALLGSNLVTLWHQGQGVALSSANNISSWNDVVSNRAATLAGSGAAPQYIADSSNFRGKPVVQFAAGAKSLATAAATLIAAGARPFVFCVTRWRDGVGDYPYVWALNDTDDMVYFTGGNAGTQQLQFVQPSGAYANAGPHDLLQHVSMAWLDGTNGNFTKDGVNYTGAATGSLGPVVNKVRLTNGVGNLSMYLWGLCTAAPSSTLRAQLADLIAADCGTPLGQPLDLLSGVVRVMDPANVVVTSGKVETFNLSNITQATAGARATYVASDSSFNNQPTAVFDGVDDVYALGNLQGMTQGEMFIVLKIANDPPGVAAKSGLHYIGGVASSTHYPFTDGVVYDGFGTNTRKTVGNPAPALTSPHVYNVRSLSGEWTLEINGTQVYTTASNTPQFTNVALFGASYSSAQFLEGTLAYAVLCERVQTPTARAAMVAYLKSRFGIA